MFIKTTWFLCSFVICCLANEILQNQNDALFNISSLPDLNHISPATETPHSKNPETHPSHRPATFGSQGYVHLDNFLSYYKIHEDKQSWHNAKEICAEENANLLVINSQQEAESVIGLLKKSGRSDKYYWIGFHNLHEEGNYVTIFNESLNSTGYEVWGPEEPDRRPGENCGVLGDFGQNSGNYSLGDWLCNTLLPYICEEKGPSELPAEKNVPLQGYTFLPHIGYLKLHLEEKEWQEAVDICQQEGASLVTVDSQFEEDPISNIINGKTWRSCIWTGLTDQYQQANYVTAFNVTPKYMRWVSGHPTYLDDRSCLEFCFDPKRLGLMDSTCTEIRSFMCAHKI